MRTAKLILNKYIGVKMKCYGFILLLAAMIMASNVNAQKLNADDSTFVAKAISGGMMEVTLGKYAQIKSSTKSVVDFGKMMEKDHSKANSELKSFIKKEKLSIDAAISKDDKKKVDDLNKLEGTKFDKEYIEAMVDDHNSDIKDFEDASGKVKNAELKQWIDKTLPTLRNHLQAAKKVQSELKNMSNK